ncbi:hypothetical protein SISSUDRAFT_1056991 [Sistotremastrum suecicum HHB10207 ss-3]|uniref:Zinc-ribbon 15 domain-containing protein n=1 Tax=Sistotremastrum suecicum HHB10207 ss-3 TaxID=1314776 RepID=A0A166IQS6_9AGAM|nr:hypothetical protein SISSUDRAFT_1056991 [Sistotremastrum suecicum HHB10207 ss-3]
MAFVCIPIVFGCPTKLTQEGEPIPRICPRCNNVSVVSAKSRTWFELFWIPLIPLGSSHVWHCNVCQWQVPHQQGYEPARAGGFPPPGGNGQWQQGPGSPSGLWQQPQQPGYQQPSYGYPQK